MKYNKTTNNAIDDIITILEKNNKIQHTWNSIVDGKVVKREIYWKAKENKLRISMFQGTFLRKIEVVGNIHFRGVGSQKTYVEGYFGYNMVLPGIYISIILISFILWLNKIFTMFNNASMELEHFDTKTIIDGIIIYTIISIVLIIIFIIKKKELNEDETIMIKEIEDIIRDQ